MKHACTSSAAGFLATLTVAGATLVACGSLPVATKEPGAGSAPPPAAREAAGDASAPSRDEGLSAIFGAPKDDGLVLTDLQVGVGQSIQLGDMAKVHYVGRLEDGTEFDSSRNRPGAFEFALGKGMVIRGFERGMVGMKIGGLRRIAIPSKLGYGPQGSPPRIPPNANLVFEIELLDIPVPAPKRPPAKGNPGAGAPPPQ